MTPKSPTSPAAPGSTRARCPVCREPVFSRAGIHPQCAVKQASAVKPKPIPPDLPSEADASEDG